MANEKRLIELEKARNNVLNILTGKVSALTEASVCVAMASATVDAEEVVHGRWEWYTDRCEDLFLGCDEDYGWRCSRCKVPLDDEDDPEVMPTFRYCPNCGAKMDGEKE